MKYLKSKYAQIKARFTAFVISRFAPDYEKIKAENKKLKQDIYDLVKNENEVEGVTAKIRWKMFFDTAEMIWFGDRTKENDL
jgi:hypothetical protein